MARHNVSSSRQFTPWKKGKIVVKNRIGHLLLLLACLTLSIPLAACAAANAEKNTLPSAEGTPSAEEARGVIIHAIFLLNTMPNRLTNTTVTADGQTHQSIIETIPPDRKSITGDGTEIIVAGGKVYLKSSETAPWQLIDVPASTYLGDMPPTEEAVGATVEGGEFVRSDTLDGREMGVFHYASTSVVGGVSLHNQTDLWVGQEDGLPYKMVIDGETLAVSVDPATGENKAMAAKALSTVLIAFDSSQQIEAPLP
jgi:hypothetical protein